MGSQEEEEEEDLMEDALVCDEMGPEISSMMPSSDNVGLAMMESKWSSDESSSRGRGLKGVAEEEEEEKSTTDRIMNNKKKKDFEKEEEDEDAMASPFFNFTEHTETGRLVSAFYCSMDLLSWTWVCFASSACMYVCMYVCMHAFLHVTLYLISCM